MSDESNNRMPLIGEKAPAFKAETTLGPVSFPDDFKGRWVVFFSHPGDFTPVCTTEFIGLAAMHDEFRALNAELLGLSIDSNFSHIAWLRHIDEAITYRGAKGLEVRFPVISDLTMEISRRYGMLQPGVSATHTVRAVFFIDPQGVVRALSCYPMSTGRNLQEIKRLLIALQHADRYQVATPADWQPGEDVIVPVPGTCGAAKERVANAGADYRCLDWFLCLKPCPKP